MLLFVFDKNTQGPPPGPMSGPSGIGAPPPGPPQGGFGGQVGYQQQNPGQNMQYQGQGMPPTHSQGNPMYQSNPGSMSGPMGGGMQQMASPSGPGSLNSPFNAMSMQVII